MSSTTPLRLILASGSRGRRELMQFHGYPFEVRPSNIPEPTEARLGDCRHYVGELAWLKAQAVAATVEDGIVIAADTVAWMHQRVVGKPEDEADARRILRMLSGSIHELWTGVCLWRKPGDWQICWQELSRVQMKDLTEAELEGYIASRQWEGCSGGYTIQMPTDPYLTVVEGSTSNVIGLPMESLAKALAWMGHSPG
jgi:septum formation protein